MPEQPVACECEYQRAPQEASRAGRIRFSWRMADLGGWTARIAWRVNGVEVQNKLLGQHEPCDRHGRVNRHGCGGQRRGKMPNLANLAGLLAGGLRVPVRERVRGQSAQRQDERDSQYTPACDSSRHAQLDETPSRPNLDVSQTRIVTVYIPSGGASPGSNLQNVALLGDHLIQHRVHVDAQEEPRKQPRHDHDRKRFLRVGADAG
jgi:hypothetical protein